ncbi:hypothetical protein DRW03_10745 [Corallococcus sp. H22C18031201]|nr:hypothetical protein DRW03_10745 [Corallococcus sp. H22C18031201]
MRLRAGATLLFFLAACATPVSSPKERMSRNPRIVNLQRAATLPWSDEGRCAVREASQPWPELAERCFAVLDHDRVRFNDWTGRCAIAMAGEAVLGTGLCVLAAPEIVAGTVIVLGAVVVGVVIKEALDAYALRGSSREAVGSAPQTKSASQDSSAKRKPEMEPSGQDWLPPVSTEPLERESRPECRPVPVPHAGEDAPHNECADAFPPNRYPGRDVLVGGERFDALQVGVRVLWEIKTHQFDTYNDYVRGRELEKELKQLTKERRAAVACGYGFVLGVSTQAHKDALLREDRSLNIVVTGCKR